METKASEQKTVENNRGLPPGSDLKGHVRHHFHRLRKFLGITETRKAIVRNELLERSAPGEEFYALIVFACAIATFGLVANSEVVAIGSQLIDPLIFPILGLSVAATSGLQHMFKSAAKSILLGMLISVAMSALISLLFYRLPYGPNAYIPETIISRTSATLLDLGIALAGGCAAVYAMAHPRLEGTIPGVAIATALMPPLCTIGFGIAFMDGGIILGAVLQFMTNLTAILFAGMVTFILLGFNPLRRQEREDVSRRVTASFVVVVAVSLLLAFFTWNTVRDARDFDRIRGTIIQTTEQYTIVELVDLTIIKNGRTREITATLRTADQLSETEAGEIQDRLTDLLKREVSFELLTVPMQVISPNSSGS